MKQPFRSSLVLYSGGLDSTVVLARHLADPAFSRVAAVTFDYDQTNLQEVSCAEILAKAWGFEHRVVKLEGLGGDAHVQIPARNTVFLAHSLKIALEDGFTDVSAGWEPGSTYADSSEPYIEGMQAAFGAHGVGLWAPVKHGNSKADTLRAALDLGVPLDLVHSCRATPVCYSCRTCLMMNKATLSLFPRLTWRELREALVREEAALEYTPCHEYRCWSERQGSFKYLPALLALAHDYPGPLHVVTTGNWGAAVMRAMHDYPSLARDLTITRATNLLSFKDSDFNTDLIHAEWGTKQALSRLPRPRFLTRSLDGPVVQGHLKLAAERLGYRWTQRAGEAAVKLVTERE
jgi:7-cyano-7-deazaguanine synthase in queuosine biosynthesis